MNANVGDILSREQSLYLQNKFQGHSDDHLTAYPVQVQGMQAYRNTPDNKFLALGGNQELHHKIIVQTLEPCYRNLSEDDAVELTRYIQEDLGFAVGNNARNHMSMDTPDHKDIHKYAVSLGAQITPATHRTKNYKDPFLGELMSATGNSSDLNQAKMAATLFLQKVQPPMEEYIDDLKTARDFGDEVEKGNVFEAIESLPAGNKRVNQMIEGSNAISNVLRRTRS